ncbi:MAG: hypothetical protein ACOH2F_07860 [Cellulomonas sp.]
MRTSTAALLQLPLLALLVSIPVSTAAAAPTTLQGAAPSGACAGASGVSVVVDLTDLGGDVVVGCATGDPTTGRQALVDAGFAVADAPTGMICTINSAPDPCPVTFEGSYWSYWSAGATSGWTAYAVGADSSDPVPGSFEGWRYNDGSTGPGVEPAALVAASTTAPTEPPAVEATVAASPVVESAEPSSGPSTATVAGLGAMAVLLAAAGVVVYRRRQGARAGDERLD